MCAAFVAGVDELEEQIATAGDDRQIADFVNDQKAWPAKEGKRSADNVRLEAPGHERFDFGCWPALSDASQCLGEPV
ncbi:hypothetical protein GGD56_006973 [Rhizobium mongolense]|uniref:Uncharacterized protein n=1 Tax=Rhizobium mongolense TaxID=57676 RepID=A0ABR6IYS2_9HYPH|nr:hypothetical protein [Rhizobium mongolense]